MIDSQPIRIAQVVGKWLGGGVEAVLMNYYRNIDRSKIQFDFICDNDSTNIPYGEIEKLGGKVILVPPYQKICEYNKALKKVFKENNYKIVHSHINTLSIFPLRIAKKCKVPIRIAHSHSTTNKKEWKKNLIKQILRPFNKLFATDYMACTEHAGRWLFGNKEYNRGNVYILNNAIDVEKFKFNEETRNKVRNELNISKDTLVLGHIGRFVEQKNHSFIIDIFNEVHKENKNSILLLIGQGPLKEMIKEKVRRLGIENSVKFLGQREDVNELYQAMDLFLFPSLYEGLGMVLVEAQCAGLECFVSTEVPIIVKVTHLINYIELKKNAYEWAEIILNTANSKTKRKNYTEETTKNDYNILKVGNKLLKKYEDLLKKHRKGKE